MPIRPENRHRYPSDWKQIRARILERAGNRCEGSPASPDCRAKNGWYRNRTTGELTDNEMQVETWTAVDGDRATRIVLTIAHLDHTPENCDPSNLRAWCQRCHLAYDHMHHQRNASRTRKVGKAAGDLFG